jgi:hypothetical protein
VLPADLYARAQRQRASADQAWLPPTSAAALPLPGVARVQASRCGRWRSPAGRRWR